MATVWLLDVDGVINVPKPGWDRHERRYVVAGVPFRITWAPELINRIRLLQTTAKDLEIRWCTSWCYWAQRLEELWNLPRLGRVFTEPVNGHELSMAKASAARQVLAAGHRLIWTDDNEVPEWGEVHDELTAGGRALLISPDSRHGLQPAHMDQVEAFLAAREEVPLEKRRGTCPVCQRSITVRRDGRIARHGDRVSYPPRSCDGYGRMPKQPELVR